MTPFKNLSAAFLPAVMDFSAASGGDDHLNHLYEKGLLVRPGDLRRVLNETSQCTPNGLYQADGTGIVRSARVQQRRLIVLLPAILQIETVKGTGNDESDKLLTFGWITGMKTATPHLNFLRTDGRHVCLRGRFIRPRNTILILKNMSGFQRKRLLRVEDVIEEVLVFDGQLIETDDQGHPSDRPEHIRAVRRIACATPKIVVTADNAAPGQSGGPSVPENMQGRHVGQALECTLVCEEMRARGELSRIPAGGLTGHLSEEEQLQLSEQHKRLYTVIEETFAAHAMIDMN